VTDPLPQLDRSLKVGLYSENEIQSELLQKVQALFPNHHPIVVITNKPHIPEKGRLYIPIQSGVQFWGEVGLQVNGEVADFQRHYSVQLFQLKRVIEEAVLALENFSFHKRLEFLNTEKRRLQTLVRKNEEDREFQKSQLEMLFKFSLQIGNALSKEAMCQLCIENLIETLPISIGAVAIYEEEVSSQLWLYPNRSLCGEMIEKVKQEMLSLDPALATSVPPIIEIYKMPEMHLTEINAFTTFPLVLKGETIGFLGLGSHINDLFQDSTLRFIHTVSNQLAVNLGRIILQKRIERSKFKSLIQGMSDGVLMLDAKETVELVNPVARQMLGIEDKDVDTNQVFERFSQMGLLEKYHSSTKEGVNIVDLECHFLEQILLVNMTTILEENQKVGTVVTFKDFTEIYKSNAIKDHRLEIMSRASKIINNLSDMNNLLSYIMDFILTVYDTDLGAIMIKNGDRYETKIHANFPDKIRDDYTLVTGQKITDYIIETRKVFIVDHYMTNECVTRNPKVPLDYFIGLPILVNGEMLAIITVAQRYREGKHHFSLEDAEATKVILAMIGTAILNAKLYQETLEKQKMDEELRIATDIQKKLLPQTIPALNDLTIGAVSIPARKIGGDYYDFFELDNGFFGFVLADIVGKGVSAGLFMAMLKSILHSHLQAIISPKEALKKVNKILFKDQVINKFVPLFYGIYDPNEKILKYANAGHEPAIYVSGDTIKMLEASGLPLGGFADCNIEEFEIKMKENDVLLLFTDGITEARDVFNNQYGDKSIVKAIMACKDKAAPDIAGEISQDVISFTKGAIQHDDITLVVIKNERAKVEEVNRVIESKRFKVNSDKSHIKTIREEVAKVAEKVGFDSEAIFNIKLALNEAHANVIQHSYGGKSAGEIIFKFLGFSDRLEITIKDFVPGANQKTTKGEDRLAELEGSGLGVFLMHSVMDVINYTRSDKLGTELVMVKYLESKKGDK